jgi:tRNA threonylcarbamoyladenosine biosynthesis protein TsaB
MADYILHIDTTSRKGIVMLTCDGEILQVLENDRPSDHASFVQPAAKELLLNNGIGRHLLNCIAVSNGPGSYTGLRVGLSAAKGLCYALNVPLVALNSHRIMAKAMSLEIIQSNIDNCHNILLAPMIDARRLEVFFALFKMDDFSLLHPSQPAVLEPSFLENDLLENIIYFSGDGATKWESMCFSDNARFFELADISKAFSELAYSAFILKEFSDLPYVEPEYAKAFYAPGKYV